MCVCVCVCVLVCYPIYFFLDVRLVDAPAGVTQEEGHTEFLHLPSAVLALSFIARRVQPFLSFVNREVEFCNFVYPRFIRFSIVGHIIYLVVYIYTVYCKEKSQFAVYARSTENLIPRDNITNRDSAMLSGIAM